MTVYNPTTAYTYGLMKAMLAIGGEVLRNDFDFNEDQAAEWANKVLLGLNKEIQTYPKRAVDDEEL